jgi:V-type H+-transporting ATPase subunit a
MFFVQDMIGNGASGAPYIISIMIGLFSQLFFSLLFISNQGMFLNPLDTNPALCKGMLGCGFQSFLQVFLLVVALLCIPVMLLVKPLLLRSDAESGQLHPDYRHHPFQFGEVRKRIATEFCSETKQLMVHQVIETIEFVLGSISNTASYLRLWALSLAHSELSIVIYEKALKTAMELSAANPAYGHLILFVAWGVWGGFTFGVLLFMEG